ncbi:hypothetical protein RQP54_15110 [Curvibacter sp. APW13]|uniref:hypothetical protein n=1 Tax=Curvibacter sp. APW13 TaxID=3077236 RepID=UPI0028DF6757|nr:hypothetical protein [Curvibacter sp. APW13]MDT8992200.1 hypothetical protein [Curvibacter sp. APW13]
MSTPDHATSATTESTTGNTTHAATKSVPSKQAAKKASVAKVSTKPATKIATKTVAKPVAKVPVPKPEKVKKVKLVRDSLSLPKDEYEVIAVLKLRAGKLGHSAKKTEIIRAGIKAVAALTDQALLKALQAVPSIKTGRPAKTKGK